MSSINYHPTFQYSQPEDYHFSHDSVFLARAIYEKHQDLLQSDIRILDLCAGCGIVGLDLLFHQLKEFKKFSGQVDFLEIQEIYHPHFIYNVAELEKIFLFEKLKLNWINKNYQDAFEGKKYDLIISNPPYFLTEQGKLSQNEFKNRCRFFIDSDWEKMIEYIQRSLKPEGRAYFLVRDELKSIIVKKNYKNITFDSQVRGTWLAELKLP